jgi:membrane-associated phospholipid phosphatase
VSRKSLRIHGLALLLLLGAQSASAQWVDDAPVIGPGQIASFAGAGLAFGISTFADWNTGRPDCAPCDPTQVPGFDRWVIRPPVSGFSHASDALLLGLAGTTLGHTASRDQGWHRVAVSLEALAWTIGLSELGKAIVGRKRPVLYTEDAPAVADDVFNQRSMPSGHTSAAFALATSYWLKNADVGTGPKVLAMASAVGVGILRVAAAKHFPSDVLVGAVLGTAASLAAHQIRF